MKRANLKNSIKWMGLLVFIGILVYALPRIDWAELGRSLRSADPLWVGFFVVSVLVTWMFRSGLFWLIIKRQTNLRFGQVTAINLIGGMMDQIVPGRSGLFVRWGLCSLRSPGKKSFIFSALMVCFVLEGAALLLLFLGSLLVSPKIKELSNPAVNWGIGLAVLSLFGGILLTPLLDRWVRDHKWRMWGPVNALFEMAHSLRKPQLLLGWLTVALGGWGLQLVGLMILQQSFAMDLDLFSLVLVLLGVNLAIALPIIPGNVGTIQIVITTILAQMHIDHERALAFSIIYHLGQFLPILILGSILTAFFPIRKARALVADNDQK